MSMFSIFNVSGSAVSAQSQRLNVVASNLANVDAVAGPDGKAYAPGGFPDPGHGTGQRRRVRVVKESKPRAPRARPQPPG
jgi:flagellar basal-body rod protein FlgC